MAMPVPAAPDFDPDLDRPRDAKTRRAAEAFGEFLRALGVDRSDPHLEGTALRVARMYGELFAGRVEGAEPALRTFPNAEGYSEMVALTDIPFHSTCAHHFLPFLSAAIMSFAGPFIDQSSIASMMSRWEASSGVTRRPSHTTRVALFATMYLT